MPHNPLFIECKGTPPASLSGDRNGGGSNGRFYNQRPLGEITRDDIVVEKYLRGVRVKPKQHVLVHIHSQPFACWELFHDLLFCLFGLILYVPSTIIQLNRDGSSWVEPVLN